MIDQLCDEQLERIILHTIAFNSGAIDEINNMTKKEHFFNVMHQEIYEIINEMNEKLDDVNIQTVGVALTKRNRALYLEFKNILAFTTA